MDKKEYNSINKKKELNKLRLFLRIKKIQHLLKDREVLFMNYFMWNLQMRESYLYKYVNIKKDFQYYLKNGKIFFNSLLEKKEKKEIDLLFISNDRFIQIQTNCGKIKSDYLFWNIIEEINKYFLKNKIALWSNKIKKEKGNNIEVIEKYKYLTILNFSKSLIYSFKIYFFWINNKKEIEILLKKEKLTNFYSILKSFFTFKKIFFNSILTNLIINTINYLNPKVIISNDEVLTFKPINSNLKKYYLIVVQSSLTTFWKEQLRREFINALNFNKIKSDYFLTSGTHFKKLFNYSKCSKKVIVTGQSRYDHLNNVEKIFNRKNILRKLGLDPYKKTILWITETHALSLKENIRNAKLMFKLIGSSDFQLIIKLHPEENQDAIFYKNKYSNVKIIKGLELDIYELIFSCDIVITKFSTVVMESIILKKPVIILNLGNKSVPINYIKDKIALGVYKEKDLKHRIEYLLKNKKKLIKNRKKFIKKYLYKIDGKATKRIVNLIQRIIDGTKI